MIGKLKAMVLGYRQRMDRPSSILEISEGTESIPPDAVDFRYLIFLSYVAGLLTMAVLYLLRKWFRKNIPDNLNFLDDDTMTWIDPWNVPSNLLSRIGETISFRRRPQRRHWPWETIRQHLTGEPKNTDNNADSDNANPSISQRKQSNDSMDAESDQRVIVGVTGALRSSRKKKQQLSPRNEQDAQDEDVDDNSTIASSIGNAEDVNDDDPQTESVPVEKEKLKKEKSACIGSIFGLDVGGTLAKLVYFEQKKLELDPVEGHLRERHYVQAASAQAVIKARMAANKTLHESNTIDEDDNDAEDTGPGSVDAATRSSTSSQESGKSSPSSPHYLLRRRSLSVGFMNRQKDLHKEKLAEQQRRKEQHQSEKDLAELYSLRQDSLPDDIRHFRHSVDFQNFNGEDLGRMFGNEEFSDSKSDDGDFRQNDEKDLTTHGGESPIPKRSTSMFDLSAHSKMQQKAEALNRFYNFAQKLDAEESVRDHKLSFYSRELGGEFHFVRFETRHMQNAMDLIRYNNLHMHICDVGATGGGAHKFADAWDEQLGIRIDKQEELDSQVAGMQFVLSTVIGECYTFRPVCRDGESSRTTSSSTHGDNKEESVGLGLSEEISESVLSERMKSNDSDGKDEDSKSEPEATTARDSNKVDDWWWSRKVQRDAISYSSAYPYIVVTIGTGVSILRVDGPRKHERISGSTIGGGTYWGLMRLLTDVETFEDAMKRAEKGNPFKLDMSVGDIYGKNSTALDKLGLPAHVVASSFGKLVAKEFPADGLTQEDLARALLLMVTNNIGLISYLNAKTVKTSRIYFVGSFLSQNMISQRRLSFAIDFWSKGEMEALFLEHEGYFGALGAFLLSQNIEEREEGFFQWDSNPNNVVEDNRYPSAKSNPFLDRKQHTFGA